jgi:hypothetical protein
MNERIRLLAISTGIFDSLCDPFDELKNGDCYSSVIIDLEKFAELIVRECASLAYDGPGGILDHFGLVEE